MNTVVARWTRLCVVVAMVAGVLAILTSAPPAQAAPGDGTVAIRVIQDYNANGAWDDPFVEPGLAGVEVRVTDESGNEQTLTTDADGLVTVVGPPGSYRIEALNPNPDVLRPSFASETAATTSNTPSDTRLSSNDEFVTVEADKTVTVTTGFTDYADYCQSNPLIVNACHPPIFTPGGALANNDSAETLFTAPYRAWGNDRGKTRLATKADTGAVYGIGYRKQDRRIFAAAFAKRGIAYGPGGPGAIYVVSADGGPTTVWGTVPDAGTRAHSFEVAGLRQDWDFAPAVGKESLGDLDVSEDGDDLQVLNLFDRKLYVYDASTPTMEAPLHVVDLSANPGCAAASDWRPGALAERHGVLYVGGVCTAESTQDPNDMRAIILTFDAETYAPTGTVMDQTINRKRESQAFLAFSCNPRDSADGVVSTSFRPWSDQGITCDIKSGGRISDPSAWMDDIVVENNGDLVMAFRDRTGDQQMGASSRYYANTDGTGAFVGVVDYVVGGDVSKACPGEDGEFVLDINGGCGIAAPEPGKRSSEFFTGDGGVHEESAYGGLALSRGERGIVSSAMDPAGGIFTQGYWRMDRATGQPLRSNDGGTLPTSPETLLNPGDNNGGNRITGGDSFSKGQGMADMEVLCDLAPIQIGNRVWNDENGDGIQDPNEGGIQGVTVNLYDAAGNLVATTVTNRRGEYYFDSINDDVEFNAEYVIRLDNPDDYDEDEPLDSDVVRLTGRDQGSGAGHDRRDSDGRLVGGFAEHAVTTGDRGDVDHTYDFGFRPLPPAQVSVGDYVWVDADGDGIQDTGEPGIPGVVLELTGPDGQPVTDVNGNLVGPVTTDENGHYSFDHLPPLEAGESYTVTINQDDPSTETALAPYVPTAEGQGGDPANDSSTWTATSGDLTQDGDRDPTLDFGFMPRPVSVGDFVWVDRNFDGVQDPGEPGIPGVVLTVVGPDGEPVTDVDGNPVGPVTTDENGFYVFTGLPVLEPGESYTVSIDQDDPSTETALAPYVPTQPGQGGDPALDSSTWTASSGDLTTPDATDMTLDFGFIPRPVSVGDFVWVDTDGDGVQEAGEPGIPGVVLTVVGPDGEPVTDVDGNPVGPVTTDENGFYVFTGLPVLEPGESYTVTIDQDDPSTVESLAPYAPTQEGQGGDPALDSSTWTASSGDLTEPDSRDMTLDFGFVPAAVSVGDFVWIDSDADGVQDAGEPGIEGVVLSVTGPDGSPVRDVNGHVVGPVTTDENGKYTFDDLPPLPAGQSYTVSIERQDPSTLAALASYVPTQPAQGGDRELDSSTWTATSGDLTQNGDRDPTLDFGFVPAKVSVGDFVWVDRDFDGLQDEGEPGIEGVVLLLTGPDGNPVTDVFGVPVGPVTTDENGAYSFDDLPVLAPGESYTVTIDQDAPSTETALAPYLPTEAGQGDDRSQDSSTWTAESGDLTKNGQRDRTLDFGFVPRPVSVGDFVWFDVDKDGIQDAGEPGIPGVVLTLTGPDGEPVTDVDGHPVGSVTTDENGYYVFAGLPVLEAGESYTVSIDRDAPSTIEALEGFAPTESGAGGDDGKDSSTWAASSGDLTEPDSRDMTLDFGFIKPSVSVGDFVWLDVDRDGIQDGGEPGIENVRMVLTGPDGQPVVDVDGHEVEPVLTDEHGAYSFDNLPVLPAGQSYTVSIDRDAPQTSYALTGLTPTTAGTGGDDELDSSTWSADSGDLTTDGARDPSLDFGFVPAAVSVGDFVWFDQNRDGLQGSGEPGIEGVVLTLTGPDGQPVTDVFGNPVGPVTTGPDGSYSFDNLPALFEGDHYTVSIDRDDPSTQEALAPYLPTQEGAGDDRGKDSATWTAQSGNLIQDGDRDATLDFGFILPAVSVGDLVFLDTDNDGVQDSGDPGIKGVVLVLTGPDGTPVTDIFGNPVGPVTTDQNGKYTFDNLPPLPAGESYTVSIDVVASGSALTGLVPTKPGQGSRETDSSTGSASSGDLTENGDRDDTLDFGFIRPGTVDGVAWVDTDQDGVIDGRETRLPGVVVELVGPDGQPVLDLDGRPVEPVTTGPDGSYSFSNLPPLPPGQAYHVVVDEAASKAALKGYQVSPVDPRNPFNFSFIALRAPTLVTKAPRKVEADVRADGSMLPVTLTDRISARGIGAEATATATLYGPTAKRTRTMCTPRNRVGRVKFAVVNGTTRSPGIKVREPGVYTWVVSIKDDAGTEISHRCGLVKETTQVKRKPYGPVVIDTGVGPEGLARVARPWGQLTVQSARISATVRTVGLHKKRMRIPADTHAAGWLNRSAALGDAIGTAVIAGHVSDNSDRPMVFWRLRNAKIGKVVRIKSGGETFKYKVTGRREFSRSKGIPKRFFSTGGPHRLVLVTCSDKVTYPNGRFHYTDNLVVVAKPLK